MLGSSERVRDFAVQPSDVNADGYPDIVFNATTGMEKDANGRVKVVNGAVIPILKPIARRLQALARKARAPYDPSPERYHHNRTGERQR